MKKNIFTLDKYYYPKISAFVFVLVFILLFFVYDFQHILFMRPQSTHQWRQCDCLSFTQSYYDENNNIFEPQMLYLGDDNSGKTASEFPIIYYCIAQIWKITGKHEYIYRAILLFLSFLSLFFFYRMTEDILRDSILALWLSFILYSAPILVYYSNNFLMNVPAFSLSLIALFYFYQFYKKSKNKYLYISVFIYAIAGLIKITALSSFAAIIGILLLEALKIVKFEKKIFFNLKYQIPPFLLLIITVTAWYLYASIYNNQHNSGIFLIGILPIWSDSIERIKHIVDYVSILWIDNYQSITVQVISIFMLAFVFIFRKYNNKLIWWITLFLFAGFISFIILWFDVFDNHDYYLINQLIFMQSIFIAFFYTLKKYSLKIYQSIFVRFLLVVLLIFNVNHCKKIIHTRYYGWPNEKHIKNTKSLESIKPYLRSIGISKQDTVIFIQDKSFNISLYLMEQKGYTNFASKLLEEGYIESKIKAGAKYIFINDESFLTHPQIKNHIGKLKGKYKNVRIFYLK